MHVAHLTLHAFRSYDALDLALTPGPTAIVGSNGQGKTNIVEAIDYLARLSSHRVSSDAPLVKQGSEQAVVRAAVVKDGRQAILEVEINPGRSNRARINRSPLPRAREIVGLMRTVLFSPEDLALVKGDPSDRRRFLDDLMVLRTPAPAGGARRLRQGAPPAQRAAQERRAGPPAPQRVLREHARGLGRPAGAPGGGDHRGPRRHGRVPAARWWRRRTPRWPRTRPGPRRAWTTCPRSRSRVVPARGSRPTGRRWRRRSRRR